ncbi:hypothetical protein L596_005810 [Steinernema carpocapsae]|uniref:Uncharacterized protein n=1 Tax=Steinernema carpocapsae TaxID=34508 RepID=A0A4U8V070_STECR|nr:hypothetical protein L596_005810 [Steinernema carpocapsae]
MRSCEAAQNNGGARGNLYDNCSPVHKAVKVVGCQNAKEGNAGWKRTTHTSALALLAVCNMDCSVFSSFKLA